MSRKIDAELFEFLAGRVPMSLAAMKKRKPWELMVAFDAAMNGIVEVGGNNRGKWVQKIQAVAGGYVGLPWCMYKNQASVACVEKVLGIKSQLLKSGHCLTVFRDAVAKGYSVNIGREIPGDMPIWRHGKTEDGHTGVIISKIIPGQILLVSEGNTSSGPGMNRDGEGAYIRMRHYGAYDNMVLQGFVRPFEITG